MCIHPKYLSVEDFGHRSALLVVQYSGEDKPEKGKKFLFNISVNGTLLYTEGLNRNRHGLFEIVYPIPDSVLQGKSSALVRFEAYDETASVGKIYDVSIVRQKLETGILPTEKTGRAWLKTGRVLLMALLFIRNRMGLNILMSISPSLI